MLIKSFQLGLFELARLDVGDLAPIGELLQRYRNLKLQLADAALLHLANRENVQTIFTLDRRDFGAVRLKNSKKLEIVPPAS